MSYNLHESFCLDSFQDQLLFWEDFEGDSIKDLWTVTGTGSAAVVDQQTGGIVRLTTGATTNDTYQINWNDIRSLLVSKKVTLEIRLTTDDLTNTSTYIQLRFDNSNRVLFYRLGAATYRIACYDGGANTIENSGIAHVAGTYDILRIECFPTGEVHFYVDGVECANSPITTNIPSDAGDYLQPLFSVVTNEDVAHYMNIDYVYIRQER